MFKGLNVVCAYTTFKFNCVCPDYPKVNSLCYSAISIPWFLVNYKGRVDRMVSYNSLFLSVSGFFLHKSLTILYHFWSQISSVLSPGTLTQSTRTDCLLSCPYPVSSTSTAATSRSLQHWWTWLQSENLAEVGLSFGLNLGLVVFLFGRNTNDALFVLCVIPQTLLRRAWEKKIQLQGTLYTCCEKVISGSIRQMIYLFPLPYFTNDKMWIYPELSFKTFTGNEMDCTADVWPLFRMSKLEAL